MRKLTSIVCLAVALALPIQPAHAVVTFRSFSMPRVSITPRVYSAPRITPTYRPSVIPRTTLKPATVAPVRTPTRSYVAPTYSAPAAHPVVVQQSSNSSWLPMWLMMWWHSQDQDKKSDEKKAD